MTGLRTRASRARMALVACALWLAGVELGPALHQALHHRLGAHRHDGDSIIALSPDAPFATSFRTSFRTSFETSSHRHADGSVHTGEAGESHSHRRPRPDERCVDLPSEAGHADGLAHRAAALASAPPPLTRPLPVDRRPTLAAEATPQALIDRVPPTAVARGPPRAA